MADTTKYEIRWDNGDVTLINAQGGSSEMRAEAGRMLINHWAKVNIHGRLIQIEETEIYRHPTAEICSAGRKT